MARYQGGKLIITMVCSSRPDTIPKQGGGTIPVIYKFEEGESVRTAAKSQAEQTSLYQNVTTAV
jgi:hypothetical protein